MIRVSTILYKTWRLLSGDAIFTSHTDEHNSEHTSNSGAVRHGLVLIVGDKTPVDVFQEEMQDECMRLLNPRR